MVTLFKQFCRSKGGKIAISLSSVFLILYTLLFTPWGNQLFKPWVEKRLNALSDAPLILSDFRLRYNGFDLIGHDTLSNTFVVHGSFSPAKLKTEARYRLVFSRFGGLNPLPMSWETSGTLNGGLSTVTLSGDARYSHGSTAYRLTLHHLHLARIELDLTAFPITPLMNRMKYLSDNDSALYGSLRLEGIHERNITGSLSLKTRTNRFKATEIPENDSNESFSLQKLLADEQGRIRHFNVDLSADLSLDEAGVAEQIIGIPLHGAIDLNGHLKGDEHHLTLHAGTTLSRSATEATLFFEDLEPFRLKLTTKHADIGSLFRFFCYRSPLEGKLDALTDLTSEGGKVSLRLSDAHTIPKIFKQEYNLTQPAIRLNALLTADLNPKGVRYQGELLSDLSRLELNTTTTHDQMLRELLNSISGSVSKGKI
ncbi:MAG: hypothetical protein M0P91_14490 [Sulfuricurvum sp.]|jgi:hypothetical protein|uniref:hypothetical protein n=1 Tax=Sulfuricurvum sp. TaxID=2025608 RepID=UPI0025FC13EF|nr:hypothetical protein [Sulfuricurvum sp.]MCK9374386.1 hypothetical protein [Sulfuricurvum sp.]